MFVQVNLMCSTARTKKVIVGLAVVALSVTCLMSNTHILYHHYIARVIMYVVFYAFSMVLPVTVLVINSMLIREVRRAANNAAANLGVHQHHQSTSSNSAVPTVMLVTTSLVYVALLGLPGILILAQNEFRTKAAMYIELVFALSNFVYAYNFYVYLITGKQFRSELRTLFCRSSSSSAAATVVVYDRNNARLERRGQANSAV